MEILKKESTWRIPGRRWFLALVIFVIASSGTGVFATAEESLEYLVKGAYLYKFGDFVEWPSASFPEPDMPFIVGVLGEDPFGADLDAIVRDRTVQGRPVVVRRYRQVSEAASAHILYISPTTKDKLEQILATLRDASILTVSDDSKSSPGIINFITVENKVRFEIYPNAATRAGLKVSSKLLGVAAVVGDGK
jgi:hypothetical protein